MSRVPLHLEPHPLETQGNEFSVFSEEWPSDGQRPYPKLGTVSYDPTLHQCTFIPGSLWLHEGFFPQSTWSCTQAMLAQFLGSPESYSPRSIYSHRLLMEIRSIFSIRVGSSIPLSEVKYAG
jgi:hypothetical protein